MLLVGRGFTEDAVFSMPLDKLFLYTDAARRMMVEERKCTVSDLVNSIGIAFSGKGFEKYMKSIEGKDG